MTPSELAAKTSVAERYAREWLSHQAASGYLEYDPAAGKFALPPEQAMVFAEPDSPVYMQGGVRSRGGDDGEPVARRARVPLRQGRGLGRPVAMPVLHRRALLPARAIITTSSASWLPALDGVAAKLERGATVADVGCGHGFSTIIMAKAFPNSTFVGYDFHPDSVEQARSHAEQHGVTANTRFEVALAQRISRQGPRSRDLLRLSARHGRSSRRGATCATDAEARRKLDDRRACGRRSAGGQSQSGQPAVLCGLDDDLRADLAGSTRRSGARRAGGLRKLSSVITEGGFGKVRKAAETPFNMILEARP